MRVTPTLASLAVALLLVPGIASAADWLQDGADAGRTGLVREAGIPAPDIAFRARTEVAPDSAPIILGGHVYVLSGDFRLQGTLAPPGLWRIDLATGEVVELVDAGMLGKEPSALTSDGERIFVATDDGVLAFGTDGQLLWQAPLPGFAETEPSDIYCRPGAVLDEFLYLGCAVRGPRSDADESIDAYILRPGRTYVVALDRATGAQHWVTVFETQQPTPGTDGTAAHPNLFVGNVAAAGERVYALVDSAAPSYGDDPEVGISDSLLPSPTILVALDRGDGTRVWDYPIPVSYGPVSGFEIIPNMVPAMPSRGVHGLVATTDRLYLKTDHLRAFEAATGSILWSEPLAEPAQVNLDAAALRGNVLFVTDDRWIFAIDTETRRTLWQTSLPDQVAFDAKQSLIVNDDHVLARAERQPGSGLPPGDELVVFDIVTGEPAWRHSISNELTEFGSPLPFNYAAGDGVIVTDDRRGNVTVLGRTAASIQLQLAAPPAYLAPGETVRIDASGTSPGVLAPDIEFRVDWGDGASAPWQTDPIFEHTYELGGERTLLVQSRNSAGQTASRAFTINVGGEAPDTGLAAALRNAFTGDSALVAWSLVFLLAIASVVTAAAVHRARDERNRSVATTGPAPTSDNTEVYREALEHAITEDGTISEKDTVMLAGLRAKLGLTERDHAIIENAVRTGDKPITGLVLEPGASVLGKYEVVRLLGEGGHGLTYLARDKVLERDVVVKVLRPGALAPEQLVDEARAMGRLRHPNVVSVHDVDRVGANVFVVMEYMDGGSLDARFEDGPLAPERFRALAGELLAALAAVHRSEQVHRDVKPANILFDDEDRAKLADFGIVQTPGLEATMGAFQTLDQAIGTVPYMSPEQAKGRSVTAASDLYSAALVLYEAWTGERYFVQGADESVIELQMRVAAAGEPDVSDIEDPAVRAWFERALAPGPSERFASAVEMLEAFEAALDPT